MRYSPAVGVVASVTVDCEVLCAVTFDAVPTSEMALMGDPLTSTIPLPLLVRFKLMFVSEPVAPMATVAGLPVAEFVIVTLSTALAVAEVAKKGLPFVSSRFVARAVPILGL